MNHDELLDTLQNLINIKPTQAEIAKVLDCAVSVITKRASRGTEYPIEDLLILSEHYGVDLTGPTGKRIRLLSQNDTNESTNCVKVVFRPEVYLSAGYGIEVVDEHKEYMLLDERLFFTDKGIKINPNNCEIVTISGNSMSPEYREGDRVILDKSINSWMDGHIFAFRYKGECYMKEICLLGNRVKAIPLNKEYEPFFIEENEDVAIFGRIVPRIRL